jgi:hypothetical protein
MHRTKGSNADQLNTPKEHLREVSADQSDRDHRANVQKQARSPKQAKTKPST